MTNKELQELLKQYPDDIVVAVFREMFPGGPQVVCGNPKIIRMLDTLIIK